MTTFFNNLGKSIPKEHIASREKFSYISAASAAMFSGMPEAVFVDFNGQPYLEMFGGAVVAVDLKLGANYQRTWLQVMNDKNESLAMSQISLTDINNSRQRCYVKAVAATYGVGMSIYLGHDGNGAASLKMLGLDPSANLHDATPVASLKADNGIQYIEWGVAVSAARITDNDFHWEVVEWDGLPYRNVLGSVLVDVKTSYAGKSITISLPVMDSAHKAMAVEDITPSDWNKAVMRALAKSIAFNSGYGLTVYAAEFGFTSASKPKNAVDQPKGKSAAEAAAERRRKAAEAEAQAEGKAKDNGSAVEPASTPAPTPAAQAEAPATPADTPASETTVEHESQSTAEPAAEPSAQADAAAEEAKSQKDAADAAETTAVVAEPAATPVVSVYGATDEERELIASSVGRFKSVMARANSEAGITGLLALFQRLEISDRFDPVVKPACFVTLTVGLCASVDANCINELLAEISKHKVAQYLDDETHKLVTDRLVGVLLTSAFEAGETEFERVPRQLVGSGLVESRAKLYEIAKGLNLYPEVLDATQKLLTL